MGRTLIEDMTSLDERFPDPPELDWGTSLPDPLWQRVEGIVILEEVLSEKLGQFVSDSSRAGESSNNLG
jgi:hypothetical protein